MTRFPITVAWLSPPKIEIMTLGLVTVPRGSREPGGTKAVTTQT